MRLNDGTREEIAGAATPLAHSEEAQTARLKVGRTLRKRISLAFLRSSVSLIEGTGRWSMSLERPCDLALDPCLPFFLLSLNRLPPFPRRLRQLPRLLRFDRIATMHTLRRAVPQHQLWWSREFSFVPGDDLHLTSDISAAVAAVTLKDLANEPPYAPRLPFKPFPQLLVASQASLHSETAQAAVHHAGAGQADDNRLSAVDSMCAQNSVRQDGERTGLGATDPFSFVAGDDVHLMETATSEGADNRNDTFAQPSHAAAPATPALNAAWSWEQLVGRAAAEPASRPRKLRLPRWCRKLKRVLQ
ncbi:hypothetical protein DFJ74DRAFT_473222 [Hyaloraphidium curvatum]|nr:hypothetical protein DFJ74DRAFT_473222 [Hyaloraphidium curvatum]